MVFGLGLWQYNNLWPRMHHHGTSLQSKKYLYIIYLQKFNVWSRRIDINNLTLTKKYLRDVKYTKHDIALEDIIAWRGFKGSKNFASPPTNVTFKVGKLSNNKFLQIFLEIVLHFNGRNLTTYHQALTTDCHPDVITGDHSWFLDWVWIKHNIDYIDTWEMK